MGQNITTALKQIACDELGINSDQLQVKLHATDSIAHVRATVGSESIMEFALPLARACATLRQAIKNGQTSGKLDPIEFPREQLRSLSGQGQWVGRSPQLEQGLEMVTGKPLYASDVRLPGMVYGRVIRAAAPPEIASSLLAMDEAAARKIKGFVALVRSQKLQMASSEGGRHRCANPRGAGQDRAGIERSLVCAGPCGYAAHPASDRHRPTNGGQSETRQVHPQ